MKDHYDFSKGIKNPYAAKLKKYGYKVVVNYGNAQEEPCETEEKGTEYLLSPDEVELLEEYRKKSQPHKAYLSDELVGLVPRDVNEDEAKTERISKKSQPHNP